MKTIPVSLVVLIAAGTFAQDVHVVAKKLSDYKIVGDAVVDVHKALKTVSKEYPRARKIIVAFPPPADYADRRHAVLDANDAIRGLASPSDTVFIDPTERVLNADGSVNQSADIAAVWAEATAEAKAYLESLDGKSLYALPESNNLHDGSVNYLMTLRAAVEKAPSRVFDVVFYGDNYIGNWTRSGDASWSGITNKYNTVFFGAGMGEGNYRCDIWQVKAGQFDNIRAKNIVVAYENWNRDVRDLVPALKEVVAAIKAWRPEAKIYFAPFASKPGESSGVRQRIDTVNNKLKEAIGADAEFLELPTVDYAAFGRKVEELAAKTRDVRIDEPAPFVKRQIDVDLKSDIPVRVYDAAFMEGVLKGQSVYDASIALNKVKRTLHVRTKKSDRFVFSTIPPRHKKGTAERECDELFNGDIRKYCDGVKIILCDAAKLMREEYPDAAAKAADYARLLALGELKARESAALGPATCRNETRGAWWFDRFAEKRELITTNATGRFDLVFFGDSITHNWERDGFGVFTEKGFGKEAWKEYFGGYSILDIGYGGDRTEHLLWRGNYGELDGYTAKLVMLMIGTNNRGGDWENVAAGIKKILDVIQARQPGAKILLLPIFPREPAAEGALRKRNAKINEVIKTYADGEKIIWLDFNDRFLDKEGNLPKELFPDYLHPNGDGYRIWAKAVKPVFEKVIGEL